MPSETARKLRRNPTEAEKRLWAHLRNRQVDGFRFRRQAPIGKYVVDFICHEAKLILELDGGQHAFQSDSDATRARWLEDEGYRVIRFWNNEVLENTDGVLERIQEALKSPFEKDPPP